MTRRLRPLLAALAALAVITGASAHRAPAPAGAATLTVYAASSLTGVFPQIDKRPRFSFAGSNALALQIRNGAPADLYVSAAPSFTQDLFRAGLVEKPETLVYNRLTLIVPRSNPAGITSVFSLRRSDIKLVVATPGVPLGSYTRQILRNLGLTQVLANTVSREPDVRSVTTKVALGEADAGFVYVTDALAVEEQVKKIALPARAHPRVRYEIAVVAASKHKAAARAFIERALGSVGRGLLSKAGFIIP